LPPHFYGELAKTADGCKVLQNSEHINEFINTMKDISANPTERRAAIWALGNIGASRTGYQQFFTKEVLTSMVDLTETSTNLSIRGTCFYTLGMISKVEEGRWCLNSLGWESPANLNSCISLPKDISRNTFLKLSNYTYEGSFAKTGEITYPNGNTELQKEILQSITHLSNFISAESASRTLKRIKAQHPDQFASPALLYEVFKLLGTYKFRLQVRRFIYDIFGDVNDL